MHPTASARSPDPLRCMRLIQIGWDREWHLGSAPSLKVAEATRCRMMGFWLLPFGACVTLIDSMGRHCNDAAVDYATSRCGSTKHNQSASAVESMLRAQNKCWDAKLSLGTSSPDTAARLPSPPRFRRCRRRAHTCAPTGGLSGEAALQILQADMFRQES